MKVVPFRLIIESMLLKKRQIVRYLDLQGTSDEVLSFSMSDGDQVLTLQSQSDERLEFYLSRRAGDPSWVVFYLQKNGCLEGYSFLHAPQEEEWLDCLSTRSSEARECSTFVHPQFRGQGVRAKILNAQFLYSRRHNREFWAVIEDRNQHSLKSAIAAGGVPSRTNFLVKFFGKNILSVSNKPFSFALLTGSRRALR